MLLFLLLLLTLPSVSYLQWLRTVDWSVGAKKVLCAINEALEHTFPAPTRPNTPKSSPFLTVRFIPSSVGPTASFSQLKSPSLIDRILKSRISIRAKTLIRLPHLIAFTQSVTRQECCSIGLQFCGPQEWIETLDWDDCLNNVGRDLGKLLPGQEKSQMKIWITIP